MIPAQADELLAKAEALVSAGRGSEVCSLQYGFVPLSAQRAVSLLARGGTDDMFSSDFTDAELALRLTPTLPFEVA